MKKAICPNDATHTTFVATAHVTQEWKIDQHGNFLEERQTCMDVLHKPDQHDIWTCDTCGAEATFE